jgi:Flp pilus assembly protein CpaB
MTYRVRNIVIAVGLALVAAMLTLFYVTNYKKSVQHGESQVQVYVAAHDVPAGTSGAQLVKRHDLKVQRVAKRTVVAGAISNPEQVARLVLSQPVYSGEQVTLRRFDDVAVQGLRAQLKGTMRAVQVPGDPNQLLAGTLKAGDHVDVVASIGIDEDKPHIARIVLRDIPVLQVSAPPDAAHPSASDATSAVLEVSDTQVERLFYVMKNADWTLQLRPVIDATDSTERAENNSTALVDGLSNAERNRLQKGAH